MVAVKRSGLGRQHGRIAAHLKPQAEVDVFEVGEERRIESAERTEHVTRYQQRSAACKRQDRPVS